VPTELSYVGYFKKESSLINIKSENVLNVLNVPPKGYPRAPYHFRGKSESVVFNFQIRLICALIIGMCERISIFCPLIWIHVRTHRSNLRLCANAPQIQYFESAVCANAPTFRPAYLASCANGFQIAKSILKVKSWYVRIAPKGPECFSWAPQPRFLRLQRPKFRPLPPASPSRGEWAKT
jgi:hypothetical protein